MKLRKVTLREPAVRLAVSVKSSTVELVEAYRASYKATYGSDIDTSALVETILKDYILSDKDFVKAQEAAKAKAGT